MRGPSQREVSMRRLAALSAVGLSLCGCLHWPDPAVFGGGSGSGPYTGAGASWQPDSPTLAVGEVLLMTWSNDRSGGRKKNQQDATWSSTDPSVATVTRWPKSCYAYAYCAEVRGRAPGFATITLRMPWGSVRNTVKVTDDPAEQQPEVEPPNKGMKLTRSAPAREPRPLQLIPGVGRT